MFNFSDVDSHKGPQPHCYYQTRLYDTWEGEKALLFLVHHQEKCQQLEHFPFCPASRKLRDIVFNFTLFLSFSFLI